MREQTAAALGVSTGWQLEYERLGDRHRKRSGVRARCRAKTSDFLANGAEFDSWKVALKWFQANQRDPDSVVCVARAADVRS